VLDRVDASMEYTGGRSASQSEFDDSAEEDGNGIRRHSGTGAAVAGATRGGSGSDYGLSRRGMRISNPGQDIGRGRRVEGTSRSSRAALHQPDRSRRLALMFEGRGPGRPRW